MGDNEQVIEFVTPNEESIDLSPVLDILGEISTQQGEIIEQNKILIDYFVPTEEEILQQEKDLQDQQEEDLKLQELEEEEKQSQQEYQLSYDQEVLNLLLVDFVNLFLVEEVLLQLEQNNLLIFYSVQLSPIVVEIFPLIYLKQEINLVILY